MTSLYALWLPILLSAVIVFIASSIIHMMSPWHKGDYPGVPNEQAARNAIRGLAIPPGDYMMPRPGSREDMKSPEFAEKVKTGPNLILTVIANGPRPMSKYLISWFVYLLVVSAFAAYVAACAVAPGADHSSVYKFVGVTAFIGYVLALWQVSIWYHRRWSTTIKATFDGIIYAVLTAMVFGWLWPR